MLASLLIVALLIPPAPPDTVITFGRVTRDLTGDNIPEVLTLVGRGEINDYLMVTFKIESQSKELFTVTFKKGRSNYDGGGRLSEADFKAQLAQFGGSFFGPRQFETPEWFVAKLRDGNRESIDLIPEVIARDQPDHDLARANATWKDMQAAGITIFNFSTGGDYATAIGWSAKDQLFVHLFEGG